jgi:hypothetical protein
MTSTSGSGNNLADRHHSRTKVCILFVTRMIEATHSTRHHVVRMKHAFFCLLPSVRIDVHHLIILCTTAIGWVHDMWCGDKASVWVRVCAWVLDKLLRLLMLELLVLLLLHLVLLGLSLRVLVVSEQRVEHCDGSQAILFGADRIRMLVKSWSLPTTNHSNAAYP